MKHTAHKKRYLGYNAWLFNNILQAGVERQLGGITKLTYSQIMVLATIHTLQSQGATALNQKSIAQYTLMREITISVILRKLASLNLVSVTTNNLDKRSKTIQVTLEGAALVADFLEIINHLENKYLANMGTLNRQLDRAIDSILLAKQ